MIRFRNVLWSNDFLSPPHCVHVPLDWCDLPPPFFSHSPFQCDPTLHTATLHAKLMLAMISVLISMLSSNCEFNVCLDILGPRLILRGPYVSMDIHVQSQMISMLPWISIASVAPTAWSRYSNCCTSFGVGGSSARWVLSYRERKKGRKREEKEEREGGEEKVKKSISTTFKYVWWDNGRSCALR